MVILSYGNIVQLSFHQTSITLSGHIVNMSLCQLFLWSNDYIVMCSYWQMAILSRINFIKWSFCLLSCQCDQLTKFFIEKMTKWLVDKMNSWPNHHFAKWENDGATVWCKKIVAEIIQQTAAITRIPGNPYWRGWLSTVDLHVLTSLFQLFFKLKIVFNFVT
jgi:hypothetical protein